MKVLVGCEFSGVVRRAFRERGHAAFSCDILPAEDKSPFHHQCDVRVALMLDSWDLFIAHPPCTRLCNSGVRWLHERNLWEEMRDSARFFKELLDADIPRVAVENPVMHGYASEIVGTFTQSFQPWQFGHGEVKRTCLWLRNLPPLAPTNIVAGRKARVHRMGPGANRWAERSRTYEGIARAMAEQWG